MLRISILLAGVLALACESSPSSPGDETAGGASSDATGGMNGTGDTGAEPEGGNGDAAAGSDATGAMGGEPNGGAPAQGEAGQTSASAGMPSSSPGDYAVSDLDECKYAPDICAAGPTPHYWECENHPGVVPADGCEPSGVNAVSSWCCPDPFCSSYAGAQSLCEGLWPDEALNSFICAFDTPGLEMCKQPNPIGLAQVYCCP